MLARAVKSGGMGVTLKLDGIGKSFGARRVLRGVCLDAAGGEIVAVTGPNGSGKSTLLKIVAGLVRPGKGRVALTVADTDASEPALRRRAVGYVSPDVAFYPELTGRENLAFFAAVRGESARELDGSLDAVGLGGRGDDPVGVYSSGMRQRLRIALALQHAPSILLLDEPGLALDASGTAILENLVRAHRAGGWLTLLATNDAREAAWGDRRIVLAA